MQQAAVQVVDSPDQAAVLLEPARLRILERLREPDSSAGVARARGCPGSGWDTTSGLWRSSGLLTHVGDRKKRNCVERLLQASARSYVVAPQILGALGRSAEELRDRFSSSYLLAAAARVLEEVTTLQPRAEAAGKLLPTLTLQSEVRFGSARSQNAFVEELVAAFAALVEKHHAPGGGRPFASPSSGILRYRPNPHPPREEMQS